MILTPLELLHCLSRLIPRPRVHRHRYHGVLAPNARLRPQHDLLINQTPAFDLTEPEPIPELDLDQSLPEEFDD